MSFAPQDPDTPKMVLMSEGLFEELVAAMAEKKGVTLTVEWGSAIRGTVTYWEPTVYEHLDPQDADPLTVGQAG